MLISGTPYKYNIKWMIDTYFDEIGKRKITRLEAIHFLVKDKYYMIVI